MKRKHMPQGWTRQLVQPKQQKGNTKFDMWNVRRSCIGQGN